MKFIKHILVLSAAAFFIVGSASESSALDYKHLPASACEWSPMWTTLPATPPPGTVVNPEYTIQANGRITAAESLANGFVAVNCPVVRDRTSDTNANLFMRVDVKDSSPTSAVSCTFGTRAADGSSGMVVTASSGNSFAGGFKELSMSGMTVSSAWGVYGLTCLLPPNAELLGYFWRESSASETD